MDTNLPASALLIIISQS